MKNTMHDYMKEAPVVALKNIENRKALTKKFVQLYTSKNYNKIVFVACGSSYNIACNAKYFVQKYLKTPVYIYWAYTFLNFDIDAVDSNSLVIFLSQSGCSTNTLEAAHALKERKIDAFSFTNFVDSPMKDEVKSIMNYGNTLGDLFVAKGFVTSTLFIMLCALEAALAKKLLEDKEYEEVLGQIIKAVNKLDEIREVSEKFYEDNTRFLQKTYRAMLIGCGPTYATGLEGCQKLEENYGCAATAFEVDEFSHGPNMEVDKDTTVFLIDADVSKVHNRILQCYRAVQGLTDRVVIITSDKSVSGDYVIRVENDGIPEEIGVLYLMSPFQYFSHKICEDLRVTAWDRAVSKYGDEMATKVPGVRY